MLFKRRTTPNHLERLRVAVWPRHSFARSARYFSKRVLRLTASPNAIALGFAAGAFASFTPLIGFHFIVSFVIAFIIGGNMLAAALGTAVGNPLTFPVIWASTFRLGTFILYGEARTLDHNKLDEHLDVGVLDMIKEALLPFFKPMLVGALPLGAAAGLISYFLVYYSVRTYQRSRRVRLAARRGIAARKHGDADLDAQP